MNKGNSWPLVPLGDLIENLQPGFAQSPDPARYNTPQIRTHNVSREGAIDLTGIKSVYATDDDIEKFGLIKGDIVFNNTNSPELVGKTAYYDLADVAVISNHMTRIRISAEVVDGEFLARYLHYLWQIGQSRNLAKQWVSQAAIDQDALLGVKIPVPPLPEQQRIATILRHAAALRRRRRETDELAQRLLPALFHEMFVKLDRSSTKVRLSDLVQEFRYGTSNKSSSEGWPVLRIPNVLNETLDVSDLKKVVITDEEFKRLQLTNGDILFVRSNGNPEFVGRSAIFESALVQNTGIVPSAFVYASYLIRARLKLDMVNPYFLQYYLASANGKAELRKRVRTSAGQYNISTEGLGAIFVLLPSLLLQDRFAKLVLKSRSFADQSSFSSIEMGLLFQSLLSLAYTGELTEAWRGKHEAELRQTAEQRDEWLKEHGFQRSTTSAIAVEAPVISGNALLTHLSPVQQRVYALAQKHPTTHFTLQTLWEAQNDDAPLDRDIIERGLTMLEALGVMLRVRIPISPTGEAFYQSVYRRATAPPIEDELRALKDRFPNIRL